MAAKKYIALITGALKQIAGTVVSSGAANAGDIVALDDTGRIDSSVMPVGIGAETKQVLTSEALAAGNWVNIYNVAGTANVRKADASSAAKYANGFVLASYSSSVPATVYLEGTNNQVSGMVPGAVYLSDASPGAGVGIGGIPTVATHIVQKVGEAVSATEVTFEPSLPVELA